MNKALLLVLSAAALFFGCKNSGTNAPADLTGNLTGDVTVKGQDCNALTDLSGVRVEAEGTAFSAMTDSKGRWTISGLPAGTYTLDFIKSGCDTMKQEAYQFVGGGVAYFGAMTIAEYPTWTPVINAIQFKDSSRAGDTIIKILGSITNIPATSPQTLGNLIYLSTDSLTSQERPVSTMTGANTLSTNPDFTATVFISNLRSWGFHSGQKIYAIACASGCSVLGYFDVTTRTTILTGFSKTRSIISFIMP